MEIKLEVVASTCIKQRKPWPRIIWLGQEKEAVFLLDARNLNEINLLSGKTKKKIPLLHPLLKNVVVLTASRNGAWLAGLLKTGEIFLWNKDQDDLKTVSAVEESMKAVIAAQECSLKLYLYVSDDGKKLLLATSVCVFLWENTECENTSSKHCLMGQWSQIIPEASVSLPSVEEKEAAVSAEFIRNEMLGDCCLCCFAFCSEEHLMLTFLEIRWQENSFRSPGSSPSQIHWAQQTCSLPNLIPCCESVKSRGALLTSFSNDGLVLAIAVNQKDPQATQILFMSTMNFVTVSGSVKGCGSKNRKVPSKFIRSYWIASMSWTPNNLFLACMLKRGSLVLMTCLGELLTLVTFGCSVEFGPAEFIPLHPLITYRSHLALFQDSNHSHNSSASEGDHMRQMFSVTSHPRLPYLIVSDGYNITVLRFCSNFSPSAFLRSLLLDSAQRLEKLHHSLTASKPREKRLPLRSLSSLRVSILQNHQHQSSFVSAIPKFLQDDEGTEQNRKVIGFQNDAEDSDEDKQFQSSSFVFGSQNADTSLSNEGRLEFASMFDTIHAVDRTEEKDGRTLELNYIQKNLLAAWRVGISRSVQERDKLLSCTTSCIVHFFSVLQYGKLNFANLSHSFKDNPWIQSVLNCFQQFLTLLSWDAMHGQTLGHLLKLTLRTLKLILAEQHGRLFPSNLLGGFSLLKMVSCCLNDKKVPQYEMLPAILDVNSSVKLDSLATLAFQAKDWSCHQNCCAVNSVLKNSVPAVKLGRNSEKRLTVLWQFLYQHVLWYRAQPSRKMLISSKPQSEIQNVHKEPMIEALASHIQAILQSSGEKLEKTLKLNSVAGEEQFLTGSYRESVEIWEKALQETIGKGGKRIPFLQTRYCLAILYCHLYYYNLSKAQGLCDHLVYELLKRTNISVSEKDNVPDAELMIRSVHTEAILAVVQSLARFMAAYFTNEPLFVLLPHNIDVLPSLHIKPDRYPRITPLQHSRITTAITDQGLSYVWTAEYCLDLFLIGGLVPEAMWLVHKLGDWKMSVSIGVAFNQYCQSNNSFSRSQTVDLYLPLYLTPTHIFQEKLKSFMGQPTGMETSSEGEMKYKQFTDPIEEEDANVLFKSVEEILKAAVMADADILSEILQLLMDCVKDLCRKFYSLVPESLYLPAPPLYCPQPAFLSEEECTDLPLRIERECRQKVSGVVQRILLLFQAAHCSFPAAQWYIMQLKWARKIMQKIRKKGSLPLLNSLPENLLNYSKSHSVFFRPMSSGDSGFDDISCRTIECFRELCALCWMLHVRERLSDSCRRYQAARENSGIQKEITTTEFDACVVEHCLKALEWACRMLPFARFMNVEELVQDIILSLIGELPPVQKVAEIWVKAFPNREDVRVPLRDKYNGLHQRLRHCVVKGPSGENMMSAVIEAAHKVNLKTLKRVIRNIGPHQRNIWEPPEEESQDLGTCCYDGFSLGTSLSRSTVSDLGNPQVYSDAETGDSVSEALLMEETRRRTPSQMQEDDREIFNHAVDLTGYKSAPEKLKDFSMKETNSKSKTNKALSDRCVLPVVGEWEFERDDDEYVKFLDLFLTYVLERDHISHGDSAVPFLKSFSALLREHELNSLLFDVHTTLKRRQNRTKSQTVFRAGSSYALILNPSNSQPSSLCDEEKKEFKKHSLPVSVQQPTEPPGHDSVRKLGSKRGLFGPIPLSVYAANSRKGTTLSPVLTQCPPDHASSVLQIPPVQKYIYKAIEVTNDVQREESAPEMKNAFDHVARLLEWMIRWSDRQLLYDWFSADPPQERRPMMHVKTSASAVLASFQLLEQRCINESQDQHARFWNPRKPCASTGSSGIPSKLEKESSVDTGYSPSVKTPVGVQGGNAYCEPYERTSRTMHEEQPEKKENNFKDHSVIHATKSGEDFDEGLIEMGGCTPDEGDVSSENEFSEEPFAASRSPTISVSIKSVQAKKQLSSSREECLQEEPLMETLDGKGEMANLNGVELSVSDDRPSLTVVSSVHSSSPVSSKKEEADARDRPSLAVVSSVHSSSPVGSKKGEVASTEPAPQPLNISDTVRQMLQDEMFKLVQLQQINFMSLMQVVGSSFASLPEVPHHLQQSQPSHLGSNQVSNPAGADFDRRPPGRSADGPSKRKQPTLENTSNSNTKSSCHQEENVPPEQNDSENIQNLPNVGDASGLREGTSFGTRMIPPFQDLLHQASPRPLPLLSASHNVQETPRLIPLARLSDNANRLPLLKLKPSYKFQSLNICLVKLHQDFSGPTSQPREAWGPPPVVENPPGSQEPQYKKESTGYLKLDDNPEVLRQAQEEGNKHSEVMNEGPSRHLHLPEYEKKENVAPSEHLHACLSAEKPLVDHDISLHKTYKNFVQIPLLCLKPRSQAGYPLPVRPVKLTSEDTESRNPQWQKGIPLLYSNVPPLAKFPTPKLIPLQKLIASEQSQAPFIGHEGHPEQIQLLKANIKPFEAREDRNNKMRQRRRVKKQIKEKEERKTVTFQETDPTLPPGILEKTKDEPNCDLKDGDYLLDPEADISSAGLHYLASVRKRPIDLQDASTNTDPVLKSHQDMQTVSEEVVSETDKNQPIISVPESELSPSCVPEMLPPDLYFNLRFPTEASERPLPSSLSRTTFDLGERKYINVIDIEDDDLLKNLPEISEPAAKGLILQSEKPEVTSSAKLHHMAASVTNSIPPEEFENEGHGVQTEPLRAPPENLEAEIAGDPLTLGLLQEHFSTNFPPGLLAKQISRERFCARLQEMDKQLSAIQNMAEKMEQEFRNTKLLVKSPLGETDPGDDEVSYYAPGVKVSREERYSARVIVEDFAEEEDYIKPESPQNSYTAFQTPSISHSASAADLTSVKKSSSDIYTRLGELDESFSEDPLNITGLSGVTDIITDLITEGAISAAELGLTHTQAKKISRCSSAVSRRPRRSEREKKELQAWMKRKRRERQEEYLQQLAEQREKEHDPFPLRNNSLGYTSREIKLQQKKKEEKDKLLLSEHHNLRVSQALSLMDELLSDTVQPGSLSKARLPQDVKRPRVSPYGSRYQAARNSTTSRTGLGETRSSSSLRCDTTQRKGLSSRAPYRRTASDTLQRELWWKSRSQRSRLDLGSQASNQRRIPSTSRATQATEESEEEMSSWSIPDEIQRILHSSSTSHLEGLLRPKDSFSMASINNLDSVSESTSSILSKLDWNAVEAMVANLEEK
ncbi:ciliogenesis and planar polarity effector 1 isoform X2 [Sphaerodactylus townsendi]|uniref:ciliogenesis and planar polarity effector 1 isoform X2 n=1 Tax=Sphaerodactylus townsendi TaxID=933632 RepID=UPI0020273572|nr:ciliogenesis and planar polarity effector 1 isoform X2 [Sphaerodactylus townsendi]